MPAALSDSSDHPLPGTQVSSLFHREVWNGLQWAIDPSLRELDPWRLPARARHPAALRLPCLARAVPQSRLLPESIPADESETLQALMDPTERDALRDWYRGDLNAIPPANVLLPRTGLVAQLQSLLNEPGTWSSGEQRLHAMLTSA